MWKCGHFQRCTCEVLSFLVSAEWPRVTCLTADQDKQTSLLWLWWLSVFYSSVSHEYLSLTKPNVGSKRLLWSFYFSCGSLDSKLSSFYLGSFHLGCLSLSLLTCTWGQTLMLFSYFLERLEKRGFQHPLCPAHTGLAGLGDYAGPLPECCGSLWPLGRQMHMEVILWKGGSWKEWVPYWCKCNPLGSCSYGYAKGILLICVGSPTFFENSRKSVAPGPCKCSYLHANSACKYEGLTPPPTVPMKDPFLVKCWQQSPRQLWGSKDSWGLTLTSKILSSALRFGYSGDYK